MLFKKNNKCNKIAEFKMNIFSYHILKLLNLMNINKFLSLYVEKKNMYIVKKTYDFDKYVKYLELKIKKMGEIINKKLKLLKNKKYNLSLKMSLN